MLSDVCIFRNIEDSNMICNQNTEYFKVTVTIFYQNQMNLNMGLRTLPFCVRPKKKICVFPVTRPTLIFPSDPKVFIGIPKK